MVRSTNAFRLTATIISLSTSLVFADPGVLYGSDAICTGYPELDTAEGHDPCELAAALIANCSPEDITLNGLDTGSTYYQGPDSSRAGEPLGECYCTGATYNALSACSYCQGGSSRSWLSYSLMCDNARPGYPSDLETALGTLGGSAITIPAWAKIDTTSLGFDINEAEEVGVDGSVSSDADRSSSTNSSSSDDDDDLLNDDDSDDSSGGGSGRRKGGSGSGSSWDDWYNDWTEETTASLAAIVGGIVGGLVGFYLLLGILAIVLVKKRKRRAMERLNGNFHEK